MPVVELLLIVLVIAVLVVIVLQVIGLRRDNSDAGLHLRLDALKDDGERLQRALREEQRAGREELQQGFDRFRDERSATNAHAHLQPQRHPRTSYDLVPIDAMPVASLSPACAIASSKPLEPPHVGSAR
ncbi:MAG: hypothetical protein WDW36_002959 [Sanguina aurantia]